MDLSNVKTMKSVFQLYNDPQFNPDNVCIVMGAGEGVGQSTAIAAAVNGLMVVGLDGEEAAGNKTQQIARELGGQMIYLPTNLSDIKSIESAFMEAEKVGVIRYLANIVRINAVDSIRSATLGIFDYFQMDLIQRPFHVSQLIIPLMKKSCGSCSVIGHLVYVDGNPSGACRPLCDLVQYGLKTLARSISEEEKGRIRSFAIRTWRDNHHSSKPPSSFDMANLFMLGFSRHAGSLAYYSD